LVLLYFAAIGLESLHLQKETVGPGNLACSRLSAWPALERDFGFAGSFRTARVSKRFPACSHPLSADWF
jgi:hypothetical protein